MFLTASYGNLGLYLTLLHVVTLETSGTAVEPKKLVTGKVGTVLKFISAPNLLYIIPILSLPVLPPDLDMRCSALLGTPYHDGLKLWKLWVKINHPFFKVLTSGVKMMKVWLKKKSDRQIIGDRHIDGFVSEILILEEIGGDKVKKERRVREER